MIVASLTSMLKTANSSENWLTSVDVAEKDEVVGRSATESVFDWMIDSSKINSKISTKS